MLKKTLLTLTVFCGGLFVGHQAESPSNFVKINPVTKITKESAVMDLQISETLDLAAKSAEVKIKAAEKTIVLEKRNMLVMRGPVTTQSVSLLQQELLAMSAKLSKSEKIYLVMDTPGGSVFAGMDLIDHLRAIPQKVETVTLFAASMGFQIVQNMDTRYITPAGTLMSHRASLGGLGGQLDGELETRYRMIKRKVDYLDAIAAKRMEMSVEDYKKMIKDEYWVHGFDAAGEKAADEMINLTCGKTLDGTVERSVQTFFGNVKVTLSECPLIRGPIKADFGNVGAENLEQVQKAIRYSFSDKKKYVDEFVLTDEHYKIFGE